MKSAQKMNLSLFSRVSFLEKLLFTKHMSVMIKSGITVSESLSTLASQTKSSTFRKILLVMLSDVENGQSLAKSLEKHKKVFDDFYISLIKVGEESGTLEENLEFLAKQLSKDYGLRKKVQGAMIYPAIILGATFIMGSFISIFILPKLVDLFSSFETELPPTTKVLLFIAFSMKDYGTLIMTGIAGLTVLVYFLLKIQSIRFVWNTTLLRLPIIGVLINYGQLSRFSRNLGTLLKSGVPIVTSLETTANTLSNLKFKNDLKKVITDVNHGKNIADSLDKKSFYEFPPLVIKMIGVGEKTGKLDETLLYLGDFYDEEIDDISKNLTTMLEPILLIGIGLVVGFVALAIISPIYELTGSIRR